MDKTEAIRHLIAQKWEKGRDAVSAIKDLALLQGKNAVIDKKGGTFRRLRCDSQSKCNWFVSVALSRRKNRPNYWYISKYNLDHQNCTGIVKPTKKQLTASSVVRSTVVANTEVSARTLVVQLQQQTNMLCSKSMLYRAKHDILSDVFSEDPQSISYLPSFLSTFQVQNPGTFTEIQHDETGHFRRAIVILNPHWFTNGQKIFGVDAAHMKHRKYNGVQIIMVGRDGNLQNRVAAVALAPLEDHDNYFWFFRRIIEHGFPLSEVPVFTDRHNGIVSAASVTGLSPILLTRAGWI